MISTNGRLASQQDFTGGLQMREVQFGDVVEVRGFPVDDYGLDLQRPQQSYVGRVVAIHWDFSKVTVEKSPGVCYQFRMSDVRRIERQEP
jgi:hypothetical protein